MARLVDFWSSGSIGHFRIQSIGRDSYERADDFWDALEEFKERVEPSLREWDGSEWTVQLCPAVNEVLLDLFDNADELVGDYG